MNKYNKYGATALQSAVNSNNPIESWKMATEDIFESKSSREKGCPKNAFLGLCEEGLVKGIQPGAYLKSKKPNLNTKYAIEAAALIKKNPRIAKNELW